MMNKEAAKDALVKAAQAYQKATIAIETSPDSQTKSALRGMHSALAAVIAAVEYVIEG